MAESASKKKTIAVDDLPWDAMSPEQIELILKRAAQEKRDRENKYMSPVKQKTYLVSVDRAVTRLLQIYRIFTEGDEDGKIAPDEKLAELIEECKRLAPDKIAESAKEVTYVKKLRATPDEAR